ncbi:MAG: ATP-dependent Clp protease adaptor ClpS [Deltaproteobacteria bacterium]|nr:ATP-dependent Clp protease adaptor ClpS [Deltaproteobacteria bacterium]
MSTRKDRDDAGGIVVTERESKTKKKLERPKLYKVLFHNDDYTTREFVVDVLMTIFRHNENDATAIMLHVHHNGVGVAGIYTHEIAETKVAETLHAAAEAEYPLLVTLEPADERDEGSGDAH